MAEESMKDYEQEINDSFKNVKKINNEDAGKWDHFQELVETKEKFDVKIVEAVKGGCIAYLDNVRGFIPASQLSTSYVEKLEDYAGKHIEVIVITADPDKKRLVMSHRAVEQAEKAAAKAEKAAAIKVGDVLDGKVESLKDYGAFIALGEGITGLLHVSQISKKRVKVPADVLKEGQDVKVKVIKAGDGKISLSIRALEEPEEQRQPSRREQELLEETGGFKYEEKTRAVTNLGDLLKGLKLN